MPLFALSNVLHAQGDIFQLNNRAKPVSLAAWQLASIANHLMRLHPRAPHFPFVNFYLMQAMRQFSIRQRRL